MIPDNAICLFEDGDQWCCVRGNFVDLQASLSGFGSTMQEAISNLIEVEGTADLLAIDYLNRKKESYDQQGRKG